MAKKRPPLKRSVLRLLLHADLEDIHAADIARHLHVSSSTLRRRLRKEHTSYQHLLNRVRFHRCVKSLSRHWVPGKSLSRRLGFSQPNSFYRAFGKWTGISFTEYKKRARRGSASK
jgi:AraC-like DNA-binding protein